MKGTKIKDLKKLNNQELQKKLEEMENALLVEKKSPKIRPVKKAIARIKTLMTQEKSKTQKNEVK